MYVSVYVCMYACMYVCLDKCYFCLHLHPHHHLVTEVRFYSGLLNETIPNYGMITQQAFGENDTGEDDGLNDGLWCQSNYPANNIGMWIGPDGEAISPLIAGDETQSVYVVNYPGQIGLLRSLPIDKDPFQGLYKCVIPDKNGIHQTLVVFIGGNDSSSMIEGNY